jgi:hypothetical protein
MVHKKNKILFAHFSVRSPFGRALKVRIIVNKMCQKVKANKLYFSSSRNGFVVRCQNL